MSSSHSSLPISGVFLARLSGSLRRRRPWLKLIDRSVVSRPTSLSDASSRIRKNVSYFRVNYLVVALSLVYHPLSLLTVFALLAAWLFLYLLRPSDRPLVLLNRAFTNGEILGVLVAVTVFVIFLTNVGSLLMSASLIGVGIVCLHGAFRDPEDLFLDDQEIPGSGLFSMINSAAASSSSSAPAAPGIVSQV